MDDAGKLEVTIKYNNLKQTISGSPENVTREYFNVLNKVIPAFEVVSSLTASPNLVDMAAKLRGLVYFNKDSIILLKKKAKLEDLVLLALVAKYIGFGLRITGRDNMSIQEIIDSTGKNKKSIIIILDKLKSAGAVDQIDDKYRVTDWKAYNYVLQRLPEKKPLKLTDFVKENSELVDYKLPAFTIGYEGQPPDKFIKFLREEGIEVLVDVRKDAYSKADMSFSEGALSKMATDVGIKYLHLPEFGVDYDLRQELRSTHDYESYFKRYSEYLDKNPGLITFLAKLLKNNVVCLMCYEKDFKRCHRSILASKLEKTGVTFHHM